MVEVVEVVEMNTSSSEDDDDDSSTSSDSSSSDEVFIILLTDTAEHHVTMSAITHSWTGQEGLALVMPQPVEQAAIPRRPMVCLLGTSLSK